VSYVLDASALLALWLNEPGGSKVAELGQAAAISAINWAEVLSRLTAAGASQDVIAAVDADYMGEIVPVGRDLARQAAALITTTRPAGLSLADRVCLALAIERDAIALTADRAWLSVVTPARVELIR
jgi:ribonuclease VapC